MEKLICWNCAAWTPPGICISCGKEVVSTHAIAEEMDNVEKSYNRVIEIRSRGKEVHHLDLNELNAVVSDNFTVIRSLLVDSPKFLIEDPGNELDAKFDKLFEDSNQLLNGLTPKLQRTLRSPHQYIIQYAYFDPQNIIETRKLKILSVFTAIAIFLAGLYNYTSYSDALDQATSAKTLLGVKLNLQGFLFAFYFTSVLVIILFVKDMIQIYVAKRFFNVELNSIFIPAPPMFEFGTLGSIAHQKTFHRTRKSMFYTSFIGTAVAWIISVAIFLISISWSKFNSDAVKLYTKHSWVENGKYEPLIAKYIIELGNFLNITNINLADPITKTYLLHPVALAALCGIYLTGLNLVPVAYLNGGQMARAQFGRNTHSFMTYFAVLLFVVSGYLFVGLIVLLFHRQMRSPEILNEESAIGKYSIFWFGVALLICLLSFPISIKFIY